LLTLNRCREILGKECTLDDEELQLLRDQLYLIAELTLSAHNGIKATPDIDNSLM
jgi:hypothetical protein